MNKNRSICIENTQMAKHEREQPDLDESQLLEERLRDLLVEDKRKLKRPRNVFNNLYEDVPKLRRSIITRAMQNVVCSTPMPTDKMRDFFCAENSANISPINSISEELQIDMELNDSCEKKINENVKDITKEAMVVLVRTSLPIVISDSSDDTCEAIEAINKKQKIVTNGINTNTEERFQNAKCNPNNNELNAKNTYVDLKCENLDTVLNKTHLNNSKQKHATTNDHEHENCKNLSNVDVLLNNSNNPRSFSTDNLSNSKRIVHSAGNETNLKSNSLNRETSMQTRSQTLARESKIASEVSHTINSLVSSADSTITSPKSVGTDQYVNKKNLTISHNMKTYLPQEFYASASQNKFTNNTELEHPRRMSPKKLSFLQEAESPKCSTQLQLKRNEERSSNIPILKSKNKSNDKLKVKSLLNINTPARTKSSKHMQENQSPELTMPIQNNDGKVRKSKNNNVTTQLNILPPKRPPRTKKSRLRKNFTQTLDSSTKNMLIDNAIISQNGFENIADAPQVFSKQLERSSRILKESKEVNKNSPQGTSLSNNSRINPHKSHPRLNTIVAKSCVEMGTSPIVFENQERESRTETNGAEVPILEVSGPKKQAISNDHVEVCDKKHVNLPKTFVEASSSPIIFADEEVSRKTLMTEKTKDACTSSCKFDNARNRQKEMAAVLDTKKASTLKQLVLKLSHNASNRQNLRNSPTNSNMCEKDDSSIQRKQCTSVQALPEYSFGKISRRTVHKEVQTSIKKKSEKMTPNRKRFGRNIFNKNLVEQQTQTTISVDKNTYKTYTRRNTRINKIPVDMYENDSSRSSTMTDSSEMLRELDERKSCGMLFKSLDQGIMLPNFSSSEDEFFGDNEDQQNQPWRLDDNILYLPRRSSCKLNFLRSAHEIEMERESLNKNSNCVDSDSELEEMEVIKNKLHLCSHSPELTHNKNKLQVYSRHTQLNKKENFQPGKSVNLDIQSMLSSSDARSSRDCNMFDVHATPQEDINHKDEQTEDHHSARINIASELADVITNNDLNGEENVNNSAEQTKGMFLTARNEFNNSVRISEENRINKTSLENNHVLQVLLSRKPDSLKNVKGAPRSKRLDIEDNVKSINNQSQSKSIGNPTNTVQHDNNKIDEDDERTPTCPNAHAIHENTNDRRYINTRSRSKYSRKLINKLQYTQSQSKSIGNPNNTVHHDNNEIDNDERRPTCVKAHAIQENTNNCRSINKRSRSKSPRKLIDELQYTKYSQRDEILATSLESRGDSQIDHEYISGKCNTNITSVVQKKNGNGKVDNAPEEPALPSMKAPKRPPRKPTSSSENYDGVSSTTLDPNELPGLRRSERQRKPTQRRTCGVLAISTEKQLNYYNRPSCQYADVETSKPRTKRKTINQKNQSTRVSKATELKRNKHSRSHSTRLEVEQYIQETIPSEINIRSGHNKIPTVVITEEMETLKPNADEISKAQGTNNESRISKRGLHTAAGGNDTIRGTSAKQSQGVVASKKNKKIEYGNNYISNYASSSNNTIDTNYGNEAVNEEEEHQFSEVFMPDIVGESTILEPNSSHKGNFTKLNKTSKRDSGRSTLLKSTTSDDSRLQTTSKLLSGRINKKYKKRNTMHTKITKALSRSVNNSKEYEIFNDKEPHADNDPVSVMQDKETSGSFTVQEPTIDSDCITLLSDDGAHDIKYLEKTPSFLLMKHDLAVSHMIRHGKTGAMGLLKLPPGRRKPLHTAKKFALFYAVIAGEGFIQVHNRSSRIETLSQFIIPLGVQYSIQNVSNKDVLILAFVKVPSNVESQ